MLVDQFHVLIQKLGFEFTANSGHCLNTLSFIYYSDLMTGIFDFFDYLPDIVALFVICSSLYAVIFGHRYGISFDQSLKEVAHRQEVYRRECDLRKFNECIANHYLKLGNSLLDISQPEAAKAAFKKVCSLDPMNIEAHLGLLKSEVFQPISKREPAYYDIEKTKKMLEIILNVKNNDPHALYFLGEFYRDFNPEKAKEYYNKVLDLKLESELDGLAYYGLAWLALLDKDKGTALELAKKAANRSEYNSVVLNGLGYVYLVNKKYDNTIKILETLLKYNPYLMPSYCNIIQAYRMTGNIKNAYVYSKKLIYCIENKDVFSIELNRRLSFVEMDSDGGVARIKGIADRKCFSYFTVALTCYLNDSEDEAHTYIDKAKSLDYCCNQSSYLKVLLYNIECIQEKYKELIPKLDNFRKIIESSDYCEPEHGDFL